MLEIATLILIVKASSSAKIEKEASLSRVVMELIRRVSNVVAIFIDGKATNLDLTLSLLPLVALLMFRNGFLR